MKKLTYFVSITGILFLLTGCPVDDQTIIRPAEKSIANKALSPRPFETINDGHRVLMGIIDAGVDYNHPFLLKNIHTFPHPLKGWRERVPGYDFVGKDFYPYPLLIRTSVHDPEKKPAIIHAAMAKHCINSAILEVCPDLTQWLHPMRNEDAETEHAMHGTHVAGLMTFDRQDFGLVVYRILPQNQKKDPKFNYVEEFTAHFESAVEHASALGVRIVNLSLGRESEIPSENEDSEKFKNENENLQNTLKYEKEQERIVSKHPDILFVAAAGNSGKWSDQLSRYASPCGMKAPNLICVGSVNSRDELSSFTNIPLNDVTLIFAIGENIRSLIPTEICNGISSKLALIHLAFQKACSPGEIEIAADQHGKQYVVQSPRKLSWWNMLSLRKHSGELQKIAGECRKNARFASFSGTSMAAPLVSHLAAEIISESPTNISPEEIIAKLYEQTETHDVGRFMIHRLTIKKPSWLLEKSPEADKRAFLDSAVASTDIMAFVDVLEKLKKENTITLEFVSGKQP